MTTVARPAALALAVLAGALAGCGGAAPTTTPATVATTATTPVQTTSTAAAPRRPASSRLVTHGPRTRRDVALTFDADMTHEMLAQLRAGTQRTWIDHALFRELDRTHTPATIFLTGLWTREYPSFVRTLARSPRYQLENHSWDHEAWTSDCYGLPWLRSDAEKRAEVLRAQREIERVAGVHTHYFRFPGGCQERGDRRIVARAGETPLQWDVVSGDPANPNTDAIVQQVLSEVRPGSIVIAHCIGAPNAPMTAAAMTRIIPALRARGYRLVTLDRLLAHRG